MATNPMQKRSRISFILGMLLMLVIAAIAVAFLYMKIQEQNKTISEFRSNIQKVYVLKSDVVSGEILTSDMFNQVEVLKSSIPSNATGDIMSTLASFTLNTADGKEIYQGNDGKKTYYYVMVGNGTNQRESRIKIAGANNQTEDATVLNADDTIYYADETNATKETKVDTSNAVIAKIDLKANTVITSAMITRSDERVTDDLRKTEYNVVTLPVDLEDGEYVDIRLQLPNGQDFIVVSKKQVTIPMANGAYLPDTVQMNLGEKEILYMSCAIVENYQIKGSKLYAVKYAEAGNQEKAQLTYVPSAEVRNEISEDPNIVNRAIEGLGQRRADIERQINQNTDEDSVSEGTEKSKESTLEARKSYLEALTGTSTTTN